MKFWLLTTEYPPEFGGGIGTYCYHTAKMFTQQGHDVTVIVNDGSLSTERAVADQEGVRVVRFRPGGADYYRHLGHTAALSYQFSEVVEELLRTESPPDVIESQDYLGIAYFLLQKKRMLWQGLSDIPVVVTLHTPKYVCDGVNQAPIYRFPDYWIGEMERFSIRAADAVLSPSQFLLDTITGELDLSERLSAVVPNPFDVEPTQPRSYDWAAIRREIVYVGRMEYRKGVTQLLEYLGAMWDEGFDVPLRIIGGDTRFHPKNENLGTYLQKRFSRYFEKGLIVFEGRIPPHAMRARLNLAWATVVPSLFENYPYTVLESMAWGNIVLASESGGQREMVQDHGKNGFLFSHDRPGSFAEGLREVFALSADDFRRISQNAQARVREICAYQPVYEQKLRLLDAVRRDTRPMRDFPFIRHRHRSSSPSVAHDEEAGLLSIVIPYYNSGPWLEETLASVEAVSYPRKEIIVVNDGTSDVDSLATLYDLERSYPIKVIHQRNKGLALARNAGAHRAKGEFVAFLDADDRVAPDYYPWAIALLQRYRNLGFVGCWSQYFEGSQAVWPTWNPEPPYLLVHNTVSSGALVVRRQDFLSYGLNDPEMAYGMEDYEFTIKMVKHGAMGVAIPKPLFYYRIRSDSMSREFNRDNVVYLYQLISEKHADFYQEFAPEVVNLINNNGPGYLYDNPTWDFPPVAFVR